MENVWLFAILGLGSGAAYAVTALGLVVIQRGSGTINFAQGAIGMVAAFCFAELVRHHVPTGLALAIVLIAAATFGASWHLAIMRPLRAAPLLAKIIATLGLLTALQGFAELEWGSVLGDAPNVLPTGVIHISGIAFGQDRLYLAGIAIVVAAILYTLYRFTTFGIATRAATESERATALLGYSPDVIAAANWAIGCALGALAGVLVSAIIGLNISGLTLLILPALAASLLGRFQSFAITAAAGLAIGIAQSEVTRFWAQPGAADALPFLLVIAAMIFTGRLIPTRDALGLARASLAPARRPRWYTVGIVTGLALLGAVELDSVYQSALTTSIITISAALSVVVVTGFVGQTSIMPMTFAGVGGLLTSKFSQDWGLPFPVPILFAVLCMVPIGLLLGLPALRVRGLNLAVVTIGAAVAVSSMLFHNQNWTGGVQGSVVRSPSMFGLSLDPTLHPTGFAVMAIVVTGAAVWAIFNLRRSPLGLRMLAVRSNERAAALSGVSVASTKLQAFGLSAAAGALSGSLLAYQIGVVSFDRFDVFSSIALITLVYIGGISVVSGAVLGGLLANGGIIYLLLQDHIPALGNHYSLIAGLLLIVTVVLNPDGVAIATRRQVADVGAFLVRRRGGDTTDRLRETPESRSADAAL
jgi:ABC-type branched-subunit amino acid transport system permease subunit